MKNFRKCLAFATMLLLSVTVAFAQSKPNIRILATGGTMLAAYHLVQKLNPKKVYINFIIELEGLKGRDIFPADAEIDCLLTLEGK